MTNRKKTKMNSGKQDKPLDRIPSYKGERYEARVPDTLDLAERANLAINAITRSADPKDKYAVYWGVMIQCNPPTMSLWHKFMKPMYIYGKYMEGLALTRLITGSKINNHVDLQWRKQFLKMLEGRPVLREDNGGRGLAWMAINYSIEKDRRWKMLGDRALRRVLKVMVNKNDYCYFPYDKKATEINPYFGKGGRPVGWLGTLHGWMLQGATKFYQSTASSVARKLADKLARYIKDHAQVFNKSGCFIANPPRQKGIHFHHNANTLVSIMEYALATNNIEFVKFAEKGYKYARSKGSPLVGFFPEYIGEWPKGRPGVVCEACCVVDMILMALWLTEAGQGDYLDDVDRYVRNQFVATQLTQSDWDKAKLTVGLPCISEKQKTVSQGLSPYVGQFGGWVGANTFYVGKKSHFMNCCTGNASRALYYVWKKIVEYDGENLRVNFLLNRASKWADINSYIPYQGRADIKIKEKCSLEIRIPEWVNPGDVKCKINNKNIEIKFKKRYALPGRVKAEDIVVITFPISEKKVKTVIGDKPYTLIIRGNEVVDIRPYRTGKVRWKKVKRFVAETE
jgi:hypothetical protein